MSTKKTIAIVLFTLQGISLFGALISGSMAGANLFQLLGFFTFAIIGFVLLKSDEKDSLKNNHTDTNYFSTNTNNEELQNKTFNKANFNNTNETILENNKNLTNLINKFLTIKNNDETYLKDFIYNLAKETKNDENNEINYIIFLSLVTIFTKTCLLEDGKNIFTKNVYTFMDFVIFMSINYHISLHCEKNPKLIYYFSDTFNIQLTNIVMNCNLMSPSEYEKITNDRQSIYDEIIMSKPENLHRKLIDQLLQFISRDNLNQPYDKTIAIEDIVQTLQNFTIVSNLQDNIMKLVSNLFIEYIETYKNL